MKLDAARWLALPLLCLCGAGSVHAAVTAEDAWIRATVPGQTVAAGYMKLRSGEPAAVVAVRTPVAPQAEIHEMSMQGGVMKMRQISRLPLPANATVEFKPGGYHLMLVNVTKALKDGDMVPLTLVIERQDKSREELRVDAAVRSAAPKPAHDHRH